MTRESVHADIGSWQGYHALMQLHASNTKPTFSFGSAHLLLSFSFFSHVFGRLGFLILNYAMKVDYKLWLASCG